MPALKSRALVALFGFAGFAVVSGASHAQSVYDALFGPRHARRPPPVYYAPSPFFRVVPVEPRYRYLPEPERARPIEERGYNTVPPPPMPSTAKPARAMPDEEIVASIMRDPTLERGDIVVFPDGPRVYKGRSGSPHRARDFEDLRGSRLVSSRTRKAVLAVTRSEDSPITVAAGSKRSSRSTSRADDVTVTGSVR